jgi:hypothetical protein
MLHLKFLEKQNKSNPKTNRWREIIKIRAEINEIITTTTKTYEEVMEQKLCSLKN